MEMWEAEDLVELTRNDILSFLREKKNSSLAVDDVVGNLNLHGSHIDPTSSQSAQHAQADAGDTAGGFVYSVSEGSDAGCRELLALEPYMALPACERTADRTADRCALPAARLGSRSEPFSRGMSFCLYASRSGANKKSPVSVDWHYMTLRNHCQKAS
ncbi:hypothetical protein EYF80_013468 [Liparis tanakae]|uniref:Uncharacterized protein n=1 Tax=Liparis tanakae TaxID=230148 RepID=A0A4Z2IE16_9TELE|nr:hypothetical protein EYF80_013468 [Liparis tanakae]